MKKILLIEDDPFLIDIYTTKLKSSGFEVRVAKDGEAAILAFDKERPDLLILDIVLPNFNGWEFLREVKGKKEYENIPIIILSNLGQKNEVTKGLEMGAVRYLIKAQYTPSEVVEEIEKILKEKENE